MLERTLLSLEVFKLRQPLQKLAEMPRGEGSFEAGPTGSLRLIATTESFEYVEPHIFPFKVRPAESLKLCRLYGLPSFIGSTRGE